MSATGRSSPHVDRPGSAEGASVLGASGLARLSLAGALSVLLWLAVYWAAGT